MTDDDDSDLRTRLDRYDHFMKLSKTLESGSETKEKKTPTNTKKSLSKSPKSAKPVVDEMFLAKLQDEFAGFTLWASSLEDGCTHYRSAKNLADCDCATDDIRVMEQKMTIGSNCQCIIEVRFKERNPFFRDIRASKSKSSKAQQKPSHIRLFVLEKGKEEEQFDIMRPIMDICHVTAGDKSDDGTSATRIKLLNRSPQLVFKSDQSISHHETGFSCAFHYLQYGILKSD